MLRIVRLTKVSNKWVFIIFIYKCIYVSFRA